MVDSICSAKMVLPLLKITPFGWLFDPIILMVPIIFRDFSSHPSTGLISDKKRLLILTSICCQCNLEHRVFCFRPNHFKYFFRVSWGYVVVRSEVGSYIFNFWRFFLLQNFRVYNLLKIKKYLNVFWRAWSEVSKSSTIN